MPRWEVDVSSLLTFLHIGLVKRNRVVFLYHHCMRPNYFITSVVCFVFAQLTVGVFISCCYMSSLARSTSVA